MCAEPPTQTVVHVYAASGAWQEASELEVTVRDHEGTIVFGPDRNAGPFSAATRPEQLARIPLSPRSGDADRSFRLEARLLDATGEVLARLEAGGRYEAAEIRHLHVAFDSTPECQAMGTECGIGQTCFEGMCVGSCFDLTDSNEPGLTLGQAPTCGECGSCDQGRCQPVEDGQSCGCDDACARGVCITTLTGDVWTGLYNACSWGPNTLYCWGENQAFRAGMPSSTDAPFPFTPADHPDLTRDVRSPTSVALSAESGCVTYIQSEGVAPVRSCFGWNEKGLLGLGTDGDGAYRFQDAIEDNVVTQGLSAGDFHMCGLDDDTNVYCWGWNLEGQSGDASGTEFVNTPNRVEVSGPVVQLSAGRATTCALLSSGHIECWGRGGNGILGDGEPTSRTYFRAEPGCVVSDEGECIDDFVGLDCHYGGCCALRSSEELAEAGDVWCWGQLDDLGFGTDSSTPVRITEGRLFQSLSMGSVLCAIEVDGAADGTGPLYCWGRNGVGEAGLGYVGTVEEPQRVGAESNTVWSKVSVSRNFVCALRRETERRPVLYCWGRNYGRPTGLGRDTAGWLGLGLGGVDGTDPAARRDILRPRRVCYD